MKRLLMLLSFIFCFVFNLSAQQEEYKVYETENGIKKVVPSQKVVVDGNTTKVYSYENGVRKINPDKVFIKSSDKIKEYKVKKSGIREIQPTTVIKKTNKKSSSGNWW